ncbi:MAG: hypothetical protein ACOYM8_18680, partial [Caulobacterales bacterium]
MTVERRVKIIKTGRGQVVRIPRGFELAGEHADEAQVPDELVVDHLEHLRDEFFVLGWLEGVRRAAVGAQALAR